MTHEIESFFKYLEKESPEKISGRNSKMVRLDD